ncbi:hypothetical protein JL720_13404 [Aureococcus anophagefferens]|nr:hypothetical protein JL720_13404 [Aureococcus anophagefferens]
MGEEQAGASPPAPKRARLEPGERADAGGPTRRAHAPSREFQKLSWESLRKGINGHVNKVNVSNIRSIVPEPRAEPRPRRAVVPLMKAQLAPGFTHIYAALAAVLNTKPRERRIITKTRHRPRARGAPAADRAFDEPTDDSVEIAVNFTKEVGQLLDQVSPGAARRLRFRGILHEGAIDKRVQYTIEGLFALRKTGFLEYPAVPEELDLVEREDQITFELSLDDKIDKEDLLDVFRVDDDFEAHEAAWADIKREILGDDESGSDDDDRRMMMMVLSPQPQHARSAGPSRT